jgi:phosphoglycolate phosphatase
LQLNRIRAVALDLDGTLLDTIPDLADSVNLMLDALSLPQLPLAQIRNFVGKGMANLVQRALHAAQRREPGETELGQAIALYEDCYESILGRDSLPYPGVRAGLDRFRAMNFKLACVTNKANRFTVPLLAHTHFSHYFDLIISGDDLSRKKPDPLPLQHVASVFGVQPDELLMIGDSLNDAQAARAAGCPVLIVPYGYNEGMPVERLDCDGIVASIAVAAERIFEQTAPRLAALRGT